MTFDYRSSEQRKLLMPEVRILLGAFFGICGSCAVLFAVVGFARGSNANKIEMRLCAVGIMAMLASVITGKFRYWFWTGLLIGAALVFLAMFTFNLLLENGFSV